MQAHLCIFVENLGVLAVALQVVLIVVGVLKTEVGDRRGGRILKSGEQVLAWFGVGQQSGNPVVESAVETSMPLQYQSTSRKQIQRTKGRSHDWKE